MRKLGSCMRSRTFLQPKAWEEGTKTTLGSTVLRRSPQIWRGKGRERVLVSHVPCAGAPKPMRWRASRVHCAGALGLAWWRRGEGPGEPTRRRRPRTNGQEGGLQAPASHVHCASANGLSLTDQRVTVFAHGHRAGFRSGSDLCG